MRDSRDLRKSLLRFIGLAYLFLGAIFVLGGLNGLTGFAILGKGLLSAGSIAGIIFFLVGIFILIISKKNKGK